MHPAVKQAVEAVTQSTAARVQFDVPKNANVTAFVVALRYQLNKTIGAVWIATETGGRRIYITKRIA